MDLNGWDERYRSKGRYFEDFEAEPAPLLIETATKLEPGRALDLACGTGRNAIWLAKQHWKVTAVDGSAAAIEVLAATARAYGLPVDAKVADLQAGEYVIEPESWDLIAICYYLQRDLFAPAKRGVVPGGIIVAIVHIAEAGEHATQTRLMPGELEKFFNDWEILHSYEGAPRDASHRRASAEIVARRPE